jgi:hypothetical protein
MAKPSRKQYSVAKMLKMANHYLARADSTPDGREAMCGMIESILLGSGNYQGYMYLDTSEIKGNGTRRFYFPHSKAITEEYHALGDEPITL